MNISLSNFESRIAARSSFELYNRYYCKCRKSTENGSSLVSNRLSIELLSYKTKTNTNNELYLLSQNITFTFDEIDISQSAPNNYSCVWLNESNNS